MGETNEKEQLIFWVAKNYVWKENGQVNLFCYIYNCPIGTKLRLKEDASEHEVSGYEWFNKGGNIIFKDGTKIDMNRFDQLVEIL